MGRWLRRRAIDARNAGYVTVASVSESSDSKRACTLKSCENSGSDSCMSWYAPGLATRITFTSIGIGGNSISSDAPRK